MDRGGLPGVLTVGWGNAFGLAAGYMTDAEQKSEVLCISTEHGNLLRVLSSSRKWTRWSWVVSGFSLDPGMVPPDYRLVDILISSRDTSHGFVVHDTIKQTLNSFFRQFYNLTSGFDFES